jgi:hypothetical protein
MKDEINVLDEAGRSPPIQWTAFSPPRRYHPHSFFDSLEDTPELYRPPKINEAPLPVSLRSSATPPEEIKLEFNYQYLEKFLTRFCIFDITATGLDEDFGGYAWKCVAHKFDDSMSDRLEALSGVNNFTDEEEKLKKLRKQKQELDRLLKRQKDLLESERKRSGKLNELLEEASGLSIDEKERINLLVELLEKSGDLDEVKDQRISELRELLKGKGDLGDVRKQSIDELLKLFEEAGHLDEVKKERISELQKLFGEADYLEKLQKKHEEQHSNLKNQRGPKKFEDKIIDVKQLKQEKKKLWWGLYDSVRESRTTIETILVFCTDIID